MRRTGRAGARRTASRTVVAAAAPVAAVAVLVAVVVLAAAAATPWSWTEPTWLDGGAPVGPPPFPQDPAGTSPPVPEELPAAVDGPGPGPVEVLLVTLAAVAVALLALAVRRALGARRGTPGAEGAPAGGGTAVAAPDAEPGVVPHLRAGVAAARRSLAPAVPPRDAVVAAWVALERAAEQAGAPRDPAQTPTEYATTVLDRTPATPAAVTTLRDLYHRARFTRHPVRPADVERARTALDRIAADLGDTRGDDAGRGGAP